MSPILNNVDFLNSNCTDGCDLECYWRVTGNNTINPSINYLGTNTPASVIIKTNSTQRAVIEGTGNGNMGIATTTPSTTLHVNSTPPSGVPSGLRLENLPPGQGNVLVVDGAGYVYRAQSTAYKTSNSSIDMMEMQNAIESMKQEIRTLKAMLNGSDGNTLSISPNPTGGQVSATYHITGSYASAMIRVTDKSGRSVISNTVSGNEGTLNFTIPGNAVSGDLICTLVVDGKITATQKLVLNKQ